jgi:hypothetical protein
LIIWVLAILAYITPQTSAPLCLVLPWSAYILSLSRPRRQRLVRAAALFWLYWTTMSLYFTLLGLKQPRSSAQLALWLELGAHVTLLWSPLELGRAWYRISRRLLGARLASQSALGLVLVLKSLYGLLDDASLINRAIRHRAAGAGFLVRLRLFGWNIWRLSRVRADELTRALVSRLSRLG